MSQPAHDPILEVELLEEIAFQKVLLSSIDNTVQNREAAENDVRNEIRTLERKLKDLRRGSTTTASSSRASITPSQQSRAPSVHPSLQRASSSTGRQLRRNSATMDGLQNSEFHTLTSTSSTASTPNSASSLGDLLLSPSKMNLPTRKRTHSKTIDGDLAPYEGNKSQRTSPSPFATGPATPSTETSGDDEFELIDQMYLQHAKAEQERLQQEKLDEEFARRLQDGQIHVSTSSTHLPGPSVFDGVSCLQHPQQSSTAASIVAPGSYSIGNPSRRTLPWASPSNGGVSTEVEPSMMVPNIKHEPPSSNMGYNPYSLVQNTMVTPKVKNEPSSRTVPSGFFDPSSDSDSDIEIIPPSAFKDNGRRQASLSSPSWNTPTGGQPVGEANDNTALLMALYGKHPSPSWMNPASPTAANYPSMNFGTLSSPLGGYNPAIYQANNSYIYPSASANNGYVANGNGNSNTHKTEPGLGYTMNNLPDYGMSFAGPSQPLASLPQNVSNPDPLAGIISRSGNNNYDELHDYLNIDASMDERLGYIINDPRKSGDEIKELLQNIRPDVELAPENREGTPEGLVYPLYEHQKLALTWLKAMEEGSNKGGILADDMGLGKTISALALMLLRPSTDRARKTTLIVGPVALIRQWEREIKQKIKVGHRLTTYLFHGQAKKRSWPELQVYDVVLTTYGTLAAEFSRLQDFLERHKNNPHYDQAPMKKEFPLLGPRSIFYRAILDEAQCIKNRNTKTSKAACAIQASYRFCLTGTPMMNGVDELYSLIRFLRIRPYSEWTRFRTDFSSLTKKASRDWQKENALQKLQAVLRAILLRRTKTSQIDGKPIITLPKKTEEIQHVIFDPEQQDFYNALESKSKIQFNRYMKAGTVGKHYSNVLVLLLRLRQACCHPHLIHDFEEAPPTAGTVSADAMMELAKTLNPEVVARILAADDAFECPVCYDVAPNPRIVIPCGHDTCAECLTKITDQAAQQNVANGNEGGGMSKCPSCRGDLELSKIIDYATFKKVYKPTPDTKLAHDASGTESETDSDDDSDDESDVGSDDSADSAGDLRDFIVPDHIDEDDVETADEAGEGEDVKNAEDGDDEVKEAPNKLKSKAKPKSEGKSKEAKRRRKIRDGKKKEKKSKGISMAMLKKEASRNKESHRRYMKYLRKHWQPSAKVTKCVELLQQFQDGGHKTIIFSQFVSLLDLLQVPIEDNDWKCLRYDGSMSADARNNAINTFTDSQTHTIMLISLKAGNAGLNLTAADRVIILDPFWNPFIEMQAVDRAYRIGQQNEVEVHRILVEQTVEDRIIELQEQKRALVGAALDEGANKSLGRLDVRQLAYLFGVGGGP